MANLAQSTFLQHLMNEETARQEQVQNYRAYSEGDFPTFLTERQATFLNVDRDKGLGANVCGVILDSVVERLNVTGFSVQEDAPLAEVSAGAAPAPAPQNGSAAAAPSFADQLGRLYSTWWQKNRMDARQKHVHRAALRDSEAFVIVSYDNDEKRPQFDHDFAHDGTNGVKVHYEPGTYNKLAYASKRWIVDLGPQVGAMRRLNLYFPNRIEKWMSKSDPTSKYSEAFWQPYEDPDDPTLVTATITEDNGNTYQASVSWWTDNGKETGKPLGVPVIPFINKDDGTGRGMSELDDAIPLQDGINKTFIDLMAAADMTGFGMNWTNGKLASNTQVYPGAMLVVQPVSGDDKSPTIGNIPAGDLSGLIALQNWLTAMLAGISSTPQSRFTPSAVKPAEGTQKQEESALVAKIEGLQTLWGNSWEDVMAMALKVARAFGAIELPDEADWVASAQWAEAQVRNEREHVEALATKRERLGVPKKQVWTEAGYTGDEIAQMEEDAAEETDARIQEQAVTDRARNTNALEAVGRLMGGPPNGSGLREPTREMSRL